MMLALGAASGAGVPARGKATRFDVVVTSPAFGGGNNAALRFSGVTGAYLGVFAGPDSGGLQDPRDIVLDRRFGERVLINSATEEVLRYDAQTGRFLGVFADFNAGGNAETPGGVVSPGGIVFGPRNNVFVGSRQQRTVLELDGRTGNFVGRVFDPADAQVAFPRGFVFGPDDSLYFGNGPNATGGGTILRVDKNGAVTEFVNPAIDAEISPLDVILSPDGKELVVSNEFPFGATDAVGTVRVYSLSDPTQFRVLQAGKDADGNPLLAVPRGMNFGPDGLLYVSSSGTGSVVRFNFATGQFVDTFIRFPGLNGQALNFVPAAEPWTINVPTANSRWLRASREFFAPQASCRWQFQSVPFGSGELIFGNVQCQDRAFRWAIGFIQGGSLEGILLQAKWFPIVSLQGLQEAPPPP